MMIKLTNPKTMKLYNVQFSGGIVVNVNLENLKNLIINNVTDPAILARVIPGVEYLWTVPAGKTCMGSSSFPSTITI
jgi:hypothetical protein